MNGVYADRHSPNEWLIPLCVTNFFILSQSLCIDRENPNRYRNQWTGNHLISIIVCNREDLLEWLLDRECIYRRAPTDQYFIFSKGRTALWKYKSKRMRDQNIVELSRESFSHWYLGLGAPVLYQYCACAVPVLYHCWSVV